MYAHKLDSEYRSLTPVWTYVVLGIAMLLCFMPAFIKWGQETERVNQQYLESVPLLTAAELLTERERLIQKLNAPVSTDFLQYFALLDRISRYEDLQEKYFSSRDRFDVSHEVPRSLTSYWMNDLVGKYRLLVRQHFEEFAKVRDAYEAEHGGFTSAQRMSTKSNLGDNTAVFDLLLKGYLGSVVLAWVLTMFRVRDKDASVFFELHNITACALLWPIMLWRYPTTMVRVAQVRRFLKLFAYSLSSFLSMGMFGGLVKAAERPLSKKQEDAELVAKTTFNVHGFLEGTAEGDGDGHNPELSKVRLNATYGAGQWSAYAEVELVGADKKGSNWLRNLQVTYKAGDGETSFTAGRIVVAGAYTLPPPTALTTVKYPWSPFGAYAYGVQLSHEFAFNLSVVTDLTFGTTGSFDSAESWEGGEWSGRVTWKQGLGQLSATAQMGSDFERFGIDGALQMGTKTTVKGAVFTSQEADGHATGGYALLTRQLDSSHNVHMQFERSPDGTKATVGLGWRPDKTGWSATLDAVHDLVTGDDNFYGRLQYAF